MTAGRTYAAPTMATVLIAQRMSSLTCPPSEVSRSSWSLSGRPAWRTRHKVFGGGRGALSERLGLEQLGLAPVTHDLADEPTLVEVRDSRRRAVILHHDVEPLLLEQMLPVPREPHPGQGGTRPGDVQRTRVVRR